MIEIHLFDNNVVSTLSKYKNYKYRFIIMGRLYSLPFINETDITFNSCNGLNDSKKALINGKIYNRFGISNISQMKNWSKNKKESSCVIHTSQMDLLFYLPQQT